MDKQGLYWSGKGRLYRRHKTDVDCHACPKCKSEMVKRLSDIDLTDGRKYVWVCTVPKCLYVISSHKIAKIDLQKVQDNISGKSSFIDDDILEIKGHTKTVYVNSTGDIWTNEADFVKNVQNPSVAAQEVRKIMASSRMSFDITAEDILKHGDPVLAEPVFEDSPEEKVIVEFGDEIISDLMCEPEIQVLCPEDQDELAVMVFDEMLCDKQASYLKNMAKESAKVLNGIFENMKFSAVGSKIKVSFDAKLASNVSKSEFKEFLLSTIKNSEFYSKISHVAEQQRVKAAYEIPDFFKLRSLLLREIKEQLA
jgi:ribosomal protein L37AE/L43A